MDVYIQQILQYFPWKGTGTGSSWSGGLLHTEYHLNSTKPTFSGILCYREVR
jgi:hypothetical protein